MMYTLKKYLRKPLTLALTLGASLLLGLLSFAGMYILLPILGVSIAAFVLSVIYEGEIYQRNIENALEKLLDDHYTAELLGEEYLDGVRNLPEETKSALPHFFKTYLKLKLASEDINAHPSAALEKRLKLMRIWLGELIIDNEAKTPFAKTVFASITDLKIWQEKADNINRNHRYIQIFSAIAATLMSLGTVYLILEVLPALPFLSIAATTLPFVVIPMSVIAGIAYGFLSYNAMTDFLLKNNLQSWWQDIKSQLTSPDRNILFAVFSALIFTLNLSLTLFTAGTWWTVVNASQATWKWLKNPLLRIASTLIAPVVSVSTLVFNLDNTIHTIEEVKAALSQKTPVVENEPSTPKVPPETLAQLMNPFRIIHKLTFTPLLILLFLGHLISIGLTADRMPGVPAIVSALAGMISEGFEDLHYFFDINSLINRMVNFAKIIFSPFKALYFMIFEAYKADNSEEIFSQLKTIMTEGTVDNASSNHGAHAHHHHEHSAIPTKVLELIFSPLFALSALWHWGFQNTTQEKPKTLWDCYLLQTGKQEECCDVKFAGIENKDDLEWIEEETHYKLGKHLSDLHQQSNTPELQTRKTAVEELQQNLSTLDRVINKHSQTLAASGSSSSTTSLLMTELSGHFNAVRSLHKAEYPDLKKEEEIHREKPEPKKTKKRIKRKDFCCFGKNTKCDETHDLEFFCIEIGSARK